MTVYVETTVDDVGQRLPVVFLAGPLGRHENGGSFFVGPRG
jgi:hypothetical protein